MLEYKGYHADIQYDADDEILVGTIFGINDSVNFHGTSVSEVTEMFHRSVDHYLEVCKKEGKNPDKEYKGSINIRLIPDLHKEAALYALLHHTSINQVINDAVAQYVSKNVRKTEG